MKTNHVFIFLIASGALLLASCDTVNGSRSGSTRSATVAKPRKGPATPYFDSGPVGNYYSAAGEGLNPEYQGTAKRFNPARKNVFTRPSGENSTWKKPTDLSGQEYEY